MDDIERGALRAAIEDALPDGVHLSPLEKMHYRADLDRTRTPIDNPVALSSEIVLGIEEWFAVQVSELGDGGKDGGTYGFDKFLAVLNRRCPSVLRTILDAGADTYV